MEYSAHAFVYALLAGLVWLLVFDIFFGKPLHVVDGYKPDMHDHDLDGVPDDARNAHFHEQAAAHHHQTGNVMSHPGEFDASHPHHRNQLNHKDLCGYGAPGYN